MKAHGAAESDGYLNNRHCYGTSRMAWRYLQPVIKQYSKTCSGVDHVSERRREYMGSLTFKEKILFETFSEPSNA